MNTKQILTALDDEIARLTQARALLTGSKGIKPAPKRKPLSAAARKRIGDAQRKRWAKAKRQPK